MTHRVARLTALALLALAVSFVGNFVLGAAAVDQPLDASRGGIADTLKQVADNRGMFLASVGFDVVGNVVAMLVAVGMFVLFSGRDRILAAAGAVTIVCASLVFLGNDTLLSVVASLANDAANGGTGADTVEVARVLAVASVFVSAIGLTFIAIGVGAFSGIIIWAKAPAGSQAAADTTPRWIGMVGMASAVFALAGGWLGLVEDALGALALPGILLSMVFVVSLAVWFLRKPEAETAAAAAMATA